MNLSAPAIFHDYLSTNLKYKLHLGPDKIRTFDDAATNGLNCGALIHLLIRRLYGFTIPTQLMCLEMFYDSELFEDVRVQPGLFQQGDIFFFGSASVHLDRDNPHPSFVDGRVTDWRLHPRLHLAMATCDSNANTAVLIHATNVQHHGVELRALQDFLKTKRYEKLHGVRRLRAQFQGP